MARTVAGTPEMGLMAAALTRMGRFYDLPTGSAGCTSDAKQAGPEAVMEKFFTTLPPVCAGADIIVGLGEIESDQLLILEQLVVDNEIAHFCERLYGGVDASESKILYEDIARSGPGGNFLKLKSTRLAARSDEFFYPLLTDRHTPEKWAEEGKPTMYSKAREKVEQILAAPWSTRCQKKYPWSLTPYCNLPTGNWLTECDWGGGKANRRRNRNFLKGEAKSQRKKALSRICLPGDGCLEVRGVKAGINIAISKAMLGFTQGSFQP